MTKETMPFQKVIEKSSDADFLRDMIDFAADRLMALEVDSLCGTGHGERSVARVNHPGAGLPEPVAIAVALVDLKIPKLWNGRSLSQFNVQAYRRGGGLRGRVQSPGRSRNGWRELFLTACRSPASESPTPDTDSESGHILCRSDNKM